VVGAPVEGPGWAGVVSQGENRVADGSQPVLVIAHEAACGHPGGVRPLDPHQAREGGVQPPLGARSSLITSSWDRMPGRPAATPPLVCLIRGLDLGFLDLVGGGVPLDGPEAQVVAHRDDNSLGRADVDHVVSWLWLGRLCAHGVHRTAPTRGNRAGSP
jgi:hypothetical protein